ncbi:DUF485 domain-containing protein [Amnimonas aquatica]|uniref:DUF485 domain-containing protein n=1 Tax=Amnimonas aquatica TaxID=2094561 RepID=A0A2P6ATX5_9GAMM|nr:DUF485 domain-containing protein [Amnimonas aquatica]PQA48885.1 DUF485 domain-containing protein [Amnimonas aquatica]
MTKEKNWEAIAASPKFQALVRRKKRVLSGLMLFSVAYYFLLPLGAAYASDLFSRQVWGPLNVGLVFALSEFVVAWSVAVIYSRIANREFDAMAAQIVAEAEGR